MYRPQPQQNPQHSQQHQPPAERKKSDSPSKLSSFLADCVTMGCLRGFKHFETYLRGKEELLCRVPNGTAGRPALDTKQQQQQQHRSLHNGDSGSYDNLARSSGKLFLSQRAQKLLLEPAGGASSIAPASPCDRELEKDESKTAFLIAGYARYKYPYVWLRSNHHRLVKVRPEDVRGDGAALDDADSPIKMQTVTNWSRGDVKLCDIIAEILTLSMPEPPSNPFAVDHDYFNQLPLKVSFLQVAAMIDFLQMIYLRRPAYRQDVLADVQTLQLRHFTELSELVDNGDIATVPQPHAVAA